MLNTVFAVVAAEKSKSKSKQIQVQANEEQRQTRRDGGSYLHVVLLCRTKSHGAYAKVKFT